MFRSGAVESCAYAAPFLAFTSGDGMSAGLSGIIDELDGLESAYENTSTSVLPCPSRMLKYHVATINDTLNNNVDDFVEVKGVFLTIRCMLYFVSRCPYFRGECLKAL